MSLFRIAAAQIASIRGDVAANVAAHVDAVGAAARCGVSVLVFPELSLTGYEPDLAASLAFETDDHRAAALRDLAVRNRMTLIVGAPIANGPGRPAIGAFICAPDGTVRTYLKMHLGSSEVAYFSHGEIPLTLEIGRLKVGVAICADSSRRSHVQTYSAMGARIYAAGVFLTEEWYVEDQPRLQKYAAEFGMLTVMANQGDSRGTYRSAGRSAVWAPGGGLLAQAAGVEPTLVVATLDQDVWRGELVGIRSAARVSP